MSSPKITPAMKIALDKISRGIKPTVSARPGHHNVRAAMACKAAGLVVHDNVKGWRLTIDGLNAITE